MIYVPQMYDYARKIYKGFKVAMKINSDLLQGIMHGYSSSRKEKAY